MSQNQEDDLYRQWLVDKENKSLLLCFLVLSQRSSRRLSIFDVLELAPILFC